MSPTPGRLRCRPADDRGSIVPAFLTLTLVTVMMGVLFFQTGRATDLGAEAQTGADAAALAAADDIRQQIIEWLATTGGVGYFTPNPLRARAAAELYAARNDTRIRPGSFDIVPVDLFTYDVHVQTATIRTVTPEGYRSEDSVTGETTEYLFGNDEVGLQEATARVGPGAGSFLTGGYYTDGDGRFIGPDGQVGGVPPARGGSCPIAASELADLAAAAGVDPGFAQNESALSRYSDCDATGGGAVAVAPLAPEMKISILKLEEAMRPTPLVINSAYRSAAAQARVCAQVTGPCATPGRSLHQAGLAIDVNTQISLRAAAQAVNADPSIGLCQPLPVNDAVHLSHATGRECGGNTGTAGGGGGGGGGFMPFGGIANLRVQAGIVVWLVE